ncbi:MAG: MFS transporter [Sphingomonadales bacterium]|nr:MFS transporter [Sphingomonadales bacterium]
MHAGSRDQSETAAGEPLRLTRPHVVILALIILLLTVDGVDMQILSVTVSSIAADWDLPISAFSAAMAMGHLGAAIGATFGGLLADRIGRRITILGGVVWFGLFTLAMLLARTPEQIAIVRLIAGLGLGSCLPTAITLVAETMPLRARPLGIALCILANPLGIATAGLFSATMMPAYGWQSMYIVFGCIPFAVALIAFFALPESPYYLSRIPAKREAAERLRIRLNLPEEPARPIRGAQPKSTLKTLPGTQKMSMLAIVGAFFCTYLALTLVLSWLPSLLTRGGFSIAIAGSALSVFSLVGACSTVLTGALMTWFGTGRIGLAFFVGVICAVIAVTLALPTSADQIAGLAGYIRFFAIIAVAGFMFNGTMTALFAHASAIFPPSVRGTALGFATMAGRTGAIIGSFIGAQVMLMFGTTIFFGMMTGMVSLGFALFLLSGAGACLRVQSPAVSNA